MNRAIHFPPLSESLSETKEYPEQSEGCHYLSGGEHSCQPLSLSSSRARKSGFGQAVHSDREHRRTTNASLDFVSTTDMYDESLFILGGLSGMSHMPVGYHVYIG